MIKNIIFDVGRVLIDWFPHETMKELGFSDTEIEKVDQILFKSGEWKEEDLSLRTPQEMEDYFASLAPEYADKIRLFYRHAVDSAKLRDYSIPFIDELKKSGYKTYILSNFGQEKKESLEQKGVFRFLKHTDGYLFSYELHKIKPAPEIYEELLKKYNLNASECVFIDDVIENVNGAQNVGIIGIQFNTIEQVCDDLNSFYVNFKRDFLRK